MSIYGAGDIVRQRALAWDHVECASHRFGGIEYRIGRREIGHMHGDYLIDIPFPKKVRDQIVAAGKAEPHHVLPETGWVSFYVRDEQDVERGIALLRRSYELAMAQHSPLGPA